MPKTKIEWCDYTINPVKGLCPMACPYCYARAMYKRFKWNPEIRYDPYAFKGLPSKPSRVFVGSTMELFGSWIDSDWWHITMAKCLSRSHHTFIFLTKQPQNLPKKFPDNCWVGVTATGYKMFQDALEGLCQVVARVKYISFEPLLEPIEIWHSSRTTDNDFTLAGGIDWVIIGTQTKSYKPPKIEWVEEIVRAADRAGIPVFLKDNLMPLVIDQPRIPYWSSGVRGLRQEMPQ